MSLATLPQADGRTLTLFRPFMERLHWLAGELRSKKQVNASIMARRFECSTRTAHRDIDFLRDRLGYNFEWNAKRNSFELKNAPQPVL